MSAVDRTLLAQGFDFRRVHGPRGPEWIGNDLVLDQYIEHAATKGEAIKRIKALRRATVSEQSPQWVARHRKILKAVKAQVEGGHGYWGGAVSV